MRIFPDPANIANIANIANFDPFLWTPGLER
jgi:hypothetical protein